MNPQGEIIDVAKHFHEVELDLTKFELGISRTFDAHWDATLRIPYFIREQTAGVRFPGEVSAADRDAAIRNANNHHRNETYTGFSDLELMAGWKTTELPGLGEHAVLRVAAGFTIPIGETEEDPWLLGNAGLEHLHVQFGNGTFDPVLEFYLSSSINEQWAWNVFGKARLPFYRNSKGFRGAPELTLAPRVSWLPSKKLGISAGLTAVYLGYTDWEETGRDPNSGQFSTLASLSLGYKISDTVTTSITGLIPVYTKTYGTEDSLDPAPTISLSVGYSF